MPFLADESCDFAVVRALRDAGENVIAVSDVAPGADDVVVLELAQRDGRVLLTEDKDFGNLVFAGGYPTGGVIFLRYPLTTRTLIAQAVVKFVQQRGQELPGSFIVIEPGRIRITRAGA